MRTKLAALCFVLFMATASPGQNAYDPDPLTARVLEQIRNYAENLSLLTCIEDTRQTVSIAHVASSEMRQDSCDSKDYKLFAAQSLSLAGGAAYDLEGRRGTTSDWRERLTAASLESNSEFLRVIAGQPDFRWLRMDTLHARKVSVFSFHVPASEGFALADPKGTIRVPYKGLVYADPATGDLIQVSLTCADIPGDSQYTGADLTLEFQSFNIAGRSIGLPFHSVVHFQMLMGRATDEADYSSYRLASFSTDTQIKFGDEVAAEK